MYDKKRVEKAIHDLKMIGLLGPRLMVLRDGPLSKTEGGIIIPEQAQKKEARGVIVKLGQSYKRVCEDLGAAGLEPGDWITFNAYDGIEHRFIVNGREWEVTVMHIGQGYCVVPPEGVEQ